ncbi:MAG: MAPEG family protein [Proteobacteria bacterium]|nr:MAPEG family protein [Pseudomonadota bacterium]
MVWVNLVTLCALLEYFIFAALVGKARATYGVKAPATSGHEVFERYFRVQQNTLELLIVFVPALWIAAQYWNPAWMAALGAIYVIGRIVYFRGYVGAPAARHNGFVLSIWPVALLLLAGIAGVTWSFVPHS